MTKILNEVSLRALVLSALLAFTTLMAPPPVAAQTTGTTSAQAAALELRIQQLESAVRALTGKVEELEFRLRQYEQGGVAATSGANTGAVGGTYFGTQLGNTGGTSAGGANTPEQGGTVGTLGSVGQSSVDNVAAGQQNTGQQQYQTQTQTQSQYQTQSQTANAPVTLPGNTPKEKYDYAFSLLRQANWEQAQLAFQSFLGEYPSDPLSGNAKYWLGETYYARGDYRQAAVTFAEGFQTYPNSQKAPDNLLKLGMSLANLGNVTDACGTFSELLRRYPDAPTTIINRTQGEQQRLGC